jgi:CubicO group peptidase (beta-lactamase class C family)
MSASRCAVILAVGLFLGYAPSAQRLLPAAEPGKPHVDDLSSLLAESVQKHKLPGMAAAIVEGGRITAIGAAGIRCRGHEERITTADQFHIGSDTKSMTGTLIAVLVEEGKLRWNSTPVEVFAARGVKDIDPGWKRVTLEELLTHRGGVRPDPDRKLVESVATQPPREQRLSICRAVLRSPPQHDPGKQYQYSNTGYILAGAMAEARADDSWENLMVRRVFKPLGIEHAGFGPPGQLGSGSSKEPASVRITQPWGHLPSGEAIEPTAQADNPPCYGPAGAVHLSLGDWARYATLHLSAGQGNQPRPPGASQQLVPVAVLRRLHTPFDGPIDKSGAKYAMGWLVLELPSHRGTLLAHDGSNTMWYASLRLFLSDNRALLIVTNQGGDGATAACAEVTRALVRRAASSKAGRDRETGGSR